MAVTSSAEGEALPPRVANMYLRTARGVSL
jgi:hypothetical protein